MKVGFAARGELSIGGILAITIALVPLASYWDNQPATIADYNFIAGTAQPGNDLTSGTVDYPSSGQANDAEPEFVGQICNNTSTPIKDLRCWLENRDGTKINSSSASPIEGLSISLGGGSYATATSASNQNGVHTFNLPQALNSNSCASYKMQVGHFAEPNLYRIKLSSSDTKAEKHFDVIGEATFSLTDPLKIFDGADPTIREGAVLTLTNGSTSNAIQSLRVTLVTNDTARIAGITLTDLSASPEPGAAYAVDSNGLGATISGLSISNPGRRRIWIDLTTAYSNATTFRVNASY